MKKKNFAKRYAEKWFKENGFTFVVKKDLITKTVYHVSKDGCTESFELPSYVIEPERYMRLFAIQFKMAVAIADIERESA